MSKLMQKIVLFIEPNDDAYSTPFKIGHLFMNRFAVDENVSFEIIKVLELRKIPEKMSLQHKRMDLKDHVQLFFIVNHVKKIF